MATALKFLFIGDIVGEPGLLMVQKWATHLKKKYNLNAIIANGENSAKTGCGITPHAIEMLKNAGVDVITTGNHAWDCKEVYNLLSEQQNLLRPINFPSECPGKGYYIFEVDQYSIAVVNLHGRVFMRELIDCPFKAIDSLLTFLKYKTPNIFVDFHAEASSEKRIMGMHLDGRITGIYGTHTHVQTADEMIMPSGTSYTTDLGYTGALHSILGMEFEGAFKKMVVHHKLGKFIVEQQGPFVLSGVVVTIDPEQGKTTAIERVRLIDNDLLIASKK
jgi:hypothetical protein